MMISFYCVYRQNDLVHDEVLISAATNAFSVLLIGVHSDEINTFSRPITINFPFKTNY